MLLMYSLTKAVQNQANIDYREPPIFYQHILDHESTKVHASAQYKKNSEMVFRTINHTEYKTFSPTLRIIFVTPSFQ